MGYIKKSVRDKLILMDKDNTMPKKWDKFIDEVKINHNLLIKGRKNLVKCTNCDFEFISKKKIGEYAKCLNCKNTYQIRSNKLKRDYFIDRIILINRIEGELVYRYFEIYSSCNKANNYKVSSSITEFARRFSENHIAVVNERMSKCQGNIYININRLYQYLTKHKGKVDLYLYRDYLRFAKLIGLDLKNKKYVFPDNLRKRHDELEKFFEIHNREILNNLIKKRYKLLKENIYNDKEFIIIPAKSVESLEDESKQQTNCVRSYSEDYANGSCDIYFLRLLKSKNKSLVTVEVRNNKVVQSRKKFNCLPDNNQLKFLKLWETKILQKCVV